MHCDPAEMVVYRGLDNVEALLVLDGDRNVVDLAGVTRAALNIGGESFDSETLTSSEIWWSETASYQGNDVNVVKLRLGRVAELDNLTDSKYTGGELLLYDGAHPNGHQAMTEIKLTIR